MAYKYIIGVLGGTFDRLHDGHKVFLGSAFSLAENLYITITSDAYTKLHKPDALPFIERQEKVKRFLEEEGLISRATLLSIDDVYGIAQEKDIPLEVIFVTEDSYKGAKKVNERRQAHGLLPLAVEIVPLLTSKTGLPISSSAIRGGLLDENGQLHIKKDLMHSVSHMTENLREKLQKPFGKIVQDVSELHHENNQKLIAVGDVTTRVLHDSGFFPRIAIIDFVVERVKQQASLQKLGFLGSETVLHCENPAGTLTPSLWEAVDESVKNAEKKENTVIIVAGEEDLAVLPALLLAPIGHTICYGQPHTGMVIVPVNRTTKKQALMLLLDFSLFTTRGH